MPEYLEPSEEFGGLPVFDFPESTADPVEAATVPAETGSVALGDIDPDPAEISRIEQGLVTDLLAAFPDLTEFLVRGSEELRFAPIRHERPEKPTIRKGGLPAEVARGVAAADPPALTHLDLWRGTPDHAGSHSYDGEVHRYISVGE